MLVVAQPTHKDKTERHSRTERIREFLNIFLLFISARARKKQNKINKSTTLWMH